VNAAWMPQIIGAQDNPEIATLHDYARRRSSRSRGPGCSKSLSSPYFPTSPRGFELACQTARAHRADARRWPPTPAEPVDDLVRLLGFRPPARALTMGWCVDCHREQNATRGAHAPLDCVKLPPLDAAAWRGPTSTPSELVSGCARAIGICRASKSLESAARP